MTFSIASYFGVMLSVERFLTERIEGARSFRFALHSCSAFSHSRLIAFKVRNSEGEDKLFNLPGFICLPRP
jgi:hypothetical protein